MTQEWVTVPIEQLVRYQARGVLHGQQCALCGDQTVPGTELGTMEQIRIHLERRHEALAETQTDRTSARLRRKLVNLGWTPPADDDPDTPAGPPGPQHP